MVSFVEYTHVGSLGFISILGKNNKVDSPNFHYLQKVDFMGKGWFGTPFRPPWGKPRGLKLYNFFQGTTLKLFNCLHPKFQAPAPQTLRDPLQAPAPLFQAFSHTPQALSPLREPLPPTDGQKFPLCSIGHCPLWACCPKSVCKVRNINLKFLSLQINYPTVMPIIEGMLESVINCIL